MTPPALGGARGGQGAGTASSAGRQLRSGPQTVRHFGLDCGVGLLWKQWDVGGEYSKKLTIRNVTEHSIKFVYKLPETRFFSMDFPETIILSAGMSCKIEVIFRPIKHEEYNDFIEFKTDGGSFRVPIRAVLKSISLDIPAELDFLFCPAHEVTTRSFQIRNVGELDATYHWSVTEPFSLSPAEGVLKPGATATIQAAFAPVDASVLVAQGVCRVGEKQYNPMTIRGIGKLPYLAVSPPSLDFGDVPCDTVADKTVTLTNPSLVPATFTLARVEADTDPTFSFSPASGVVQPGKSLPVKFSYRPLALDTFSRDTFHVTTPGGTKAVIACSGRASGPSFSLSVASVNFGQLTAGASVRKSLYINNHSAIPMTFHLVVEKDSLFSFDKIQGTVGPNSNIHVTVTFAPREPIVYYRRVFCLVRNQHPQFVDLLGSCCNDMARPPPMFQRHVDRYYARQSQGLSRIPPERLEEVIKSGEYKDLYENPNQEMDAPDHALWESYFYEGRGASRDVRIEEPIVDFGSCSRMRLIDAQVVHVTNNTSGKVTYQWMVPPTAAGAEPVFQVIPDKADVKPNSTYAFKVTFRPTQDNQVFGQVLECFAYFKTMRNFRLVTEDSITPSWCLTVPVCGDTNPPEPQFTPDTHIQPKRINFAPCLVGSFVHNVAQLTNTGDTPVRFAFLQEEGSPFTCKPAAGVVHGNTTILITFRFAPTSHKRLVHRLKCILNSSTANVLEVALVGSGQYPAMTLPSPTLFLKPTCVGALSERTFTVRNPSRATVNFEWNIPESARDIISVEPASGIMLGNESVDTVWSYRPKAVGNEKYKVSCALSSAQHEQSERLSETKRLTVVGESMVGTVKMEPAQLDFGTVQVGSKERREITLLNNNDCAVHFSLAADDGQVEIINDLPEYARDAVAAEAALQQSPPDFHDVISMEPSSGMVPARSVKVVRVVFTPSHHCRGSVTVRCRVQFSEPVGEDELEEGSNEQGGHDALIDPCVRVTGLGVFPVVNFTDVRSALGGMSTSQLWKQLSLERLNRELTLDPIGAQEGTRIIQDLRAFRLDFGAAEAGQNPTQLLFKLENMGKLPATWFFKMPNEIEVDVERWADTGMVSKEDAGYNEILDKKLFTVVPRNGRLAPGESTLVAITYFHRVSAVHELPVVFELEYGKRVTMVLAGRTFSPKQKRMQVYSRSQPFRPLPIGCDRFPIQWMRLFNPCTQPVSYAIDVAPLTEVKKDNYDFDVFECLEPSGTIPAESSSLVPWRFRPLECRHYALDVNVLLQGGKGETLEISGYGFHPKDAAANKYLKVDPTPAVPQRQTLVTQSQIALLSLERLSFGQLPVYAVSRQLVILENLSTLHALTYTWAPADGVLEDVIEVRPSSGTLLPGQHVVAKVIFSAGADPAVFDANMACTIVPIVDGDRDSVDMDHQEETYAETARGMSVRTGTKDAMSSLGASQHGGMRALSSAGGSKKKKHVSVVERAMARGATKSGKGDLANIHNQSRSSPSPGLVSRPGLRGSVSRASHLDNLAASVGTLDTATSTINLNPTVGSIVVPSGAESVASDDVGGIPLPSKLLLRVQGQVMTIPEYKTFHSDFDKFVLRKEEKELDDARARLETPGVPPPRTPLPFAAAPSEEMLACQDVLTRMLAEIVHDPAIAEAFEQLEEEPVPFFVQFAGEQPASPRANSDDGAGSDSKANSPGARRSGNSSASGLGDGGDEDDDEDAAEEPDAESAQDGKDAAPAAERGDPYRKTYASVVFEDVVASVLESAIFNMIAETTHEEIDLTAMPMNRIRVMRG